MQARKLILLGAVWAAVAFMWPGSPFSQLIEPSRTLREGAGDAGTLNVYSEPPGLEVRLDGDPIGRTPVRSHRLPAGAHVLRIRDSEREIHIAPDARQTISWFKGAFIDIPEKRETQRPSEQPSAQRPPQPQPSPSQPDIAPNDPFYWPLNPKGPIY